MGWRAGTDGHRVQPAGNPAARGRGYRPRMNCRCACGTAARKL
jgi:hypothetical protein